jgi:hypothetical protein
MPLQCLSPFKTSTSTRLFPFPLPFPSPFSLPSASTLFLHPDMITVEPPTPSPELPTHKPSLADLSRNASVLSSSSSSSSTTSLVLPVRPRPTRTFSSPRSRSPGGPPTPKASRPPAYITRELGIAEQPLDSPAGRSRANSKSKSRSSSANGRLSADDFEFGDILGEGSYSTVRSLSFISHCLAYVPPIAGDTRHTPCNETRICHQGARQRSPQAQQQTQHCSRREKYPRPPWVWSSRHRAFTLGFPR